MSTTISALRDWDGGQANAERLAAGIVRAAGYTDIDPQHPLGGPDGGKDILCNRNGSRFLAAVHFPSTLQTFSDLKGKFVGDFAGAVKHAVDGFIFLTNQHLTVSQRDDLRGAVDRAFVIDIFHQERLRDILDSPRGLHLRLQYLGIGMTLEDQWVFFNESNLDLVQEIRTSEARQTLRLERIEQLLGSVDQQTRSLQEDFEAALSSMADATMEGARPPVPCSRRVDVDLLCWLHRVALEGSTVPPAIRGVLRTVDVWIGGPGSTPETATYTPAAPEGIPSRLHAWSAAWNANYLAATGSSQGEVIELLAKYHYELLSIHPFLDGNGRVARSVLDQASLELLRRPVSSALTEERESYFAALRAANTGDFVPLENRILSAME